MAIGGQKRLAAIRSAAESGQFDRRFLTAARYGIFLALGFIMSSARVLADKAPFGVAMVASAGSGLTGVAALLGASLGYLLGGGLEWGIRYIAAAVLVYAVMIVLTGTLTQEDMALIPRGEAVGKRLHLKKKRP